MSKKTKLVMDASLLRIILSVSILLIVAIAIAGFVYSLGILKTYAVEVSHKKVDAEASNGNIQALEKVQKELDANSDVLSKINLLKSDSQFPEFPVVDQVKKIAANNNLSIDSFSYGDSAATATTTTTPPATTTTPTTPTTAVAPAGGNTIALSVTLKSPVNYKDLLQFTYDIEQNLPKMKIKGISMSKGTATTTAGQPSSTLSGNQVNIDPVTIEMYIN